MVDQRAPRHEKAALMEPLTNATYRFVGAARLLKLD